MFACGQMALDPIRIYICDTRQIGTGVLQYMNNYIHRETEYGTEHGACPLVVVNGHTQSRIVICVLVYIAVGEEKAQYLM